VYNSQHKNGLTLKSIESDWLRKKLYVNDKLLEWDHTFGDWRIDDHAWNANTNNK
jgi:hypothetical protein